MLRLLVPVWCHMAVRGSWCEGIVSISTMLFPVPFYFSWFPPVDSWLVHPSQYVKRLRVPCISSSCLCTLVYSCFFRIPTLCPVTFGLTWSSFSRVTAFQDWPSWTRRYRGWLTKTTNRSPWLPGIPPFAHRYSTVAHFGDWRICTAACACPAHFREQLLGFLYICITRQWYTDYFFKLKPLNTASRAWSV